MWVSSALAVVGRNLWSGREDATSVTRPLLQDLTPSFAFEPLAHGRSVWQGGQRPPIVTSLPMPAGDVRMGLMVCYMHTGAALKARVNFRHCGLPRCYSDPQISVPVSSQGRVNL